jgi:hypothetical protein
MYENSWYIEKIVKKTDSYTLKSAKYACIYALKMYNIYYQKQTYLINGSHFPLYRYIHMYIPWIHRFIPKTVQCGTSHKYTNTYIVHCKMLKTIYKTVSWITYTYKKFIYIVKGDCNLSIFFRLFKILMCA